MRVHVSARGSVDYNDIYSCSVCTLDYIVMKCTESVVLQCYTHNSILVLYLISPLIINVNILCYQATALNWPHFISTPKSVQYMANVASGCNFAYK